MNSNEKVLQISLDIIVGENADGNELANDVRAELERRGLSVVGSDFQRDVTKYYEKYDPDLHKDKKENVKYETLFDYLQSIEDGEELTVWDADYDIETYFYNDSGEDDIWQMSMLELAKLLTVKEVRELGVIVDLAEIIENKLDVLKETNLFKICKIDPIMDSIEMILSGNVSERWLETFVAALKK